MHYYTLEHSNADWVTDDLLSKIRDNPILAEGFNDPSLSEALAQFQSNPQAVAAATKDNPKVCSICDLTTSTPIVLFDLLGSSIFSRVLHHDGWPFDSTCR